MGGTWRCSGCRLMFMPSANALLCQPGQQLWQRHGTALARDFAAFAKEDQARNGADAELRRQLRVGFAVELGRRQRPSSWRAAWAKVGRNCGRGRTS